MRNHIVLALDASTTHVGMSVWNRDQYMTGLERAYPGKNMFRRVLAIRNDVATWTQEYQAGIIAAECPIFDPRHGPDTLYELSLPIAAIGLWATEHMVRFETIYPTSAKAALGNGRAGKAEMIRLAEMYLGYNAKIAGEHHADSIGVFAALWQTKLAIADLEERAHAYT